MELTPSPASVELLDQLLQRKRGMRVFAPAMATRTQVLDQLATMTSPALVPHLVIFGMVANSEERLQADAIVGSILDALNVRELLEFDRCVRDRVRMSATGCPPWTTLKAWDLSVLGSSEVTAAAIIGATSFHASGHVREAAVRLLDKVETGAELRFLLIRLNDWVPAVRSAAQQAVQRRLKSGYAVAFARNIDLIERLLHWERADHTVLLRWIVEYLRGEEGAHAVEAVLGSAEVRQRRLLYTLLLSADRDCSDALVRRALADDDPVCRLRGIRVASRHLSGDALRDVLYQALEDSFAPVRLVAVRALAAGSFGEIETTFIALLMDAAPSIRAVARHHLRQVGWTDFIEHYARQLIDASRDRTCTALRAIGEVGTAASAARVLPYVSTQDSRVAAAALRTLAVLDGDAYIAQFLDAVRTTQPGLVKEAARALSARIRLVDLSALWSMSLDQPWGLVRRRILALLFTAPKWDALLYLLGSLRDPHPAVVAFSREYLNRWLTRFNQSSPPLSDALQEALRAAFQNARTTLTSDTVRELDFILR
jgi:HEAT repeat protein